MNAALGLAALAFVVGCAGNSDAIARGQHYYEDNQYERALAVWRDLERRGAALEPAERTRYAYLRGMTDYRLGFRDDARHWLAVAKAGHERAPGSLIDSWSERLDAALSDLTQGSVSNTSGDVVQTIAAPSSEETEPSSIRADPASGTTGADAGLGAPSQSASPVQP